MIDPQSIDLQAAHRHFAPFCFNKTWEYIDMTERSEEENLAMLLTSFASFWHWTQRKDCKPVNLAVGYWQISRVYSSMGEAENARKYAQLCLNNSGNLAPFYMGEAFEAMARAEKVAGNPEKMQFYLKQAELMAVKITDEEEKQILLRDLKTLKDQE